MTRSLIQQCSQCRAFSFKAQCPHCKAKTKNPLPPKFSPEDAYGEYRRRLRRLGPAVRGA